VVDCVGERALGLCTRPDGLYDCYDSQWAASPEWLYPVLREGEPGRLLHGCDWAYRGVRSPGNVVATLDYLAIDAVYVVSPAGLGVALPVWLGIDLGDGSGIQPGPSFGALVFVEAVAEARSLRTGIRRLKGRLGRRVDRGELTIASAVDRLLAFLDRFRYRLSPTVRAVATDPEPTILLRCKVIFTVKGGLHPCCQ
jgi:hypothetical protein